MFAEIVAKYQEFGNLFTHWKYQWDVAYITFCLHCTCNVFNIFSWL